MILVISSTPFAGPNLEGKPKGEVAEKRKRYVFFTLFCVFIDLYETNKILSEITWKWLCVHTQCEQMTTFVYTMPFAHSVKTNKPVIVLSE